MKVRYPWVIPAGGIALIIAGMLFPVYSQRIWFNIILRIREAITTGDSGHLILASASYNFLHSIQTTIIYMGTMLVIFHTELKRRLKYLDIFLVSLIIIIF
jgi:hypothetical protein